ncbi:hypothetical protein [Oricola indica]|uniref:hypothetical protein n=1 Tax=Oricola indica TaxID=2872591 RepID=UPI003CCC0659
MQAQQPSTAADQAEFKVVYLDTADRPVASCRVTAGDYLEACAIAHRINPQAPEFEVSEMPV